MNEVFIAGAARTPMGGFQGAFSETPAARSAAPPSRPRSATPRSPPPRSRNA
jgi:hypothetical protein